MNFSKPTLTTITAPTCSGKSYLLNQLTSNFTRLVSTTTRAARENEQYGHDYYFISQDTSDDLLKNDEYIETVQFRGARYGVTRKELEKKMESSLNPVVILEPSGLEAYETICRERGWDIFRIFIYTKEEVRIQRLIERTSLDIQQDAQEAINCGWSRLLPEDVNRQLQIHTNRLLSITSDERCWQTSRQWDLLIPGDDTSKAIEDIRLGIEWRNKKYRSPSI